MESVREIHMGGFHRGILGGHSVWKPIRNSYRQVSTALPYELPYRIGFRFGCVGRFSVGVVLRV